MASKRPPKSTPPRRSAPPPPRYGDIAARLAEALADADMRQAELARRVNARPNTISALFTGRAIPQQSTLVAICWELGVWDSWVLYGPPNPKHIDAASKAMGITVLRGHLPRKSASTGLRQWLDNTAEGRRTTAEERDWLCGIAWPQERADAAYDLAVRAYRALPSSTRK